MRKPRSADAACAARGTGVHASREGSGICSRDRRARRGALDAALAERQAAIAQRNTMVTGRHTAIDQRNSAVSQRETALAERQPAIAARDQAWTASGAPALGR